MTRLENAPNAPFGTTHQVKIVKLDYSTVKGVEVPIVTAELLQKRAGYPEAFLLVGCGEGPVGTEGTITFTELPVYNALRKIGQTGYWKFEASK